MHLVFDFGFGEGGAVVDAPVDRLQSLVDEVLLEEFVECFDDLRFILLRHGEIGIVPSSKNRDAFELRFLQVDIFLRVLAAGAANGDGVHLELLATELFIHFDFDWQAMTVPAGNIRRIVAGHGF
jgi:hypothetical protein